MIAQYYLLVSSYQSQDTAILVTFGLAMFLLFGWAVSRRVGQLAERLYVGQMLAIYIGLLIISGWRVL